MNRDSPAVSDGRAELLDHIRKEIRQDGPLPFSRFQELALYHPEFGYYTLGAAIGEAGGDFLTAPEMGPLFGELIGLQVGEMSRILGDPAGFTLAEVGGGHGSLARALLDAWRRQNHPLYRPGVYRILERSPALRARQRRVLEPHGGVVRVEEGLLEASPPSPSPAPPGVVLLNEVLDALPVDRVRGAASCLQEVRVGLDGDRLVETCVPAGRELQDLLQKRLPAGMTDLAPGHEVEMCPTLGRFLAAVSRLIGRGYLLVVDYGHEIRERFHPSRRRGTMLAYRRHQASEDLLGFVGEQDLTSHVDFSALKKEAAAFGFRQAGCISQGRFLLALGLGERIEALEVEPISETERTRRRLAMASLVRPGGMGDLFRVWIAVREAPAKLRGLAEPFSSLQETGPV